MPKYFFIAEKDTLREAIKTAYNTLKSPPYSAVFDNVFGYYIELQEPDEYRADWGKPYRPEVLPLFPQPFKFKVKSDFKSKSNAPRLKNELLSGKYDYIVNACDAGREGESIFWTLYNYSGCTVPVKRLWVNDNSVEAMAKALLNLRDYATDDKIRNLKDSAFCRMELDWLVGMNLSRAAMISTHKPVSVGRVKSPTLNIVVQRDLEIANFKPQDFFEIEGQFDGYLGTWFKDKITSLSSKTEAEAIVKKLGKTGVIKDVKKETISETPPPLYSLPELQKEANIAFGFTAQDTLNVAQSLYETHKVISYPRTDSQALTTAMANEIPDLLNTIKDVPEISKFIDKIKKEPSRITTVQKNKKYVDNKKVTDHHAIICTKTKPDLSKMTLNEQKLYILILKKFVSIFLDPKVSARTTIITDVSGEMFKSVGIIILQQGYTELIRDSAPPAAGTLLPNLKDGDTTNVIDVKIKGKQTQPPRPYTDATILTAMENAGRFVDDKEMKKILSNVKGIGTPATQAGIIEELIKKNFIFRKGKTLRASDFGIQSIKILDGRDIISPKLTAEWEQKLQSIYDGEISRAQFQKEMTEFITKETDDFLKHLGTMDNMSLGKCPICGKNIIDGKNYYRCEDYKKGATPCTFISGKEIGGKQISCEDMKDILSGKPTKVMKFKSKAGKTFSASLALDEKTKQISYIFADNAVIGKCPKCGKDFIEKSGSYSCECGFFIAKKLKGATITQSDVKNLISGKSTASKKFFNDAKKPWYAKLKYSKDFTHLEFEFTKKD